MAYLTSIMRSYIQSYAGLPKTCWDAITLTFIEAIAGGLIFFLSLYFVGTLHIDLANAGIMISLYGVGRVIGGIVGGKLSDHISPKIVANISLFIQALTYFLLTYLNSINLLMINLFFMGISVYGFHTANDVWMLKQCGNNSETRLKAINISRAALNLGFGLSGILVGIFTNEGFKNIFYLSAIFLFLGAIYFALQKDNKESIIHNDILEKASHDNQKSIPTQKENKTIVTVILICLFLIGLIVAQLGATYPIYVQNAFPLLGVKAVSILFILDTVLIVLFQAPLINLLNNRNKIFTVGMGAFLMGLGMFVLSMSSTFILAIISCVIWTTGEMLFMSMARLVCYEKGADKKKGQSMGAFQATYAVSTVIGPAIGGFIYQYLGGNMLWYLSGMIGLFCLIACTYYKKYD